MKRSHGWVAHGFLLAAALSACSSPASDTEESAPAGGAGTAATPTSAGTSGDTTQGGSGSGSDTDDTDEPSGSDAAGSSSDSAGSGADEAGAPAAPSEEPAKTEALPDGVDWTALTVGAADSTGKVHANMYSAFDGVQTFKVPARVEGATVELSGWVAVPSSAVLFEADPDADAGVMITVLAAGEITIGAMTSDMLLGGAATLHVMQATETAWMTGEARYDNGVDYVMPNISFADLLDPNYVPPETPDDLACNNCHTSGAKYLEIQHTPTQIAYISDTDLLTIFT